MQQKTYLAKKGEVKRNWVVVDLADQVLGRVATRIANTLRGKTKVAYTPHEDTGDFVIALNAAKIRLTGKKLTDKKYYRHSGFKGGIKEETAGHLLQRKPEEVIRLAVRGMLPKNKMQKHLLKKFQSCASTAPSAL